MIPSINEAVNKKSASCWVKKHKRKYLQISASPSDIVLDYLAS